MEYKELCKKCLLHQQKLYDCPFCSIDFKNQASVTCAFKGLYSKKHRFATANMTVQINNNNLEVIKYNEEFSLQGNKSTAKRGRKWYYIEKDVLAKVDKEDPNTSETQFQLSKKKSRRRALNLFLNYGQNNDWQYFITMTFDPAKINSTSQQDIKYSWQKFRQKLQYYFPNIQIMAVVEYHADDNKLHFHGVIGNADLKRVLVRAINQQQFLKDKYGNIIYDKNGIPKENKYYLEPLITNLGDMVYNFYYKYYDDGFCSVIPLADKTNDMTVSDKIVFYLAKYMSKDKSAVPYNGKSFFRTYNLNKANKECIYMTDEDFTKFIEHYKLQEKNKNDKFTSYVQRLDLAGIFDKAQDLFRPINTEIDIQDIYDKAKTIFETTIEELDPIFLED